MEDSLAPDDVDDSRQVTAVGPAFLLDAGLGLQGALLIFAAGRRHDPLQRRVDGLAHLRSEVQELGDRRVSCERRVPRRRRIRRGEALAELRATTRELVLVLEQSLGEIEVPLRRRLVRLTLVLELLRRLRGGALEPMVRFGAALRTRTHLDARRGAAAPPKNSDD